MRATARAWRALCAGALLGMSGCLIATGPSPEPLAEPAGQPLVRLGDVNVRYTGSWADSAPVEGFRSSMTYALREGRLASLFTSDPAGLLLHVDLVVDHQDDEPRLIALGLLSLATLGVIPLTYYSEWNTTCEVRITTGDAREVARYSLVETGTYRIFALPPTMFTLLGAGVRGDADYKKVEKKIARNLAGKIHASVSADQARLARIQESNVPTLEALGGGAPALFERGRLYLELGRREEARGDLLRYAEEDPRLLGELDETRLLEFYDVDARRQQTVQAAARARGAEQSGDLVDAFRQYQRAYALAPGEVDEVERFASALAKLYPQLPVLPQLPEAARRFFIQGQEEARTERYEEAARSFARVTRIVPWYPQAHFNRALVMERLERYGDAAESMQRFLALEPDSEHARTARDRLYEWRGRGSGPASLDGLF
jgi:tetratricopeptide (TPR) repeat protein